MPPTDDALAAVIGPAEAAETARTVARLLPPSLAPAFGPSFIRSDHLYDEFVLAGIAGRPDSAYPDRETLLRKTPAFCRQLALPRLSTVLRGASRFLAVHFGGEDLYRSGTERNLERLEAILSSGDLAGLGASPPPQYHA